MSRYDELEALKESMGKGQPVQPKKEADRQEPEASEEGDKESKSKAKKRIVKKEEA